MLIIVHIYLGTLWERGALSVDLKILEAELSAYMMVGTEVPTELPPLPGPIADLLGTSGRSRGESGKNTGRVTTSTNDSRIGRSAYSTQYAMGNGFATGAHLDVGFDPKFAILYASIRAMLGFDMNMTKVNRPCLETGKIPGVNGYYASGQVYAGLWGEVGINVDLWFVQKKIPFLELAAAAALQGKLPNPYWFMGRVGLYYSVLGGLVSGKTNFKVEVGQECELADDLNPFSDIEFIADVKPDPEPDISVFTNPTVSFNLPVNEYLELPAGDEEDPGRVYVYEPFIDHFTVTDLSEDKEISGVRIKEPDNLIAYYRIGEMLKGRTRYKAEITVKAYQHFEDGRREIVKILNSATGRMETWTETKSTTFTTGPQPDHIPEENIKFTYPVKRQAYFLKNETSSNLAIIRLNKGMGDLFDGTIERSGEEKEFSDYVARFINVETEEKTDVELTYSGGSNINIPLPDLENSAYYALQIVAKQALEAAPVGVSASVSGSDSGDGDVLTVGETIENEYADKISPQPLVKKYGLNEIKIQVYGQELPGARVGRYEHLLYKYYFRTSQYNSLAEKLGGSSFNTAYKNLLFIEGFDLTTDISEPFDEFDIYGLAKDGRQVLPPLLNIISDPNSSYIDDKASFVYDLQVRRCSIPYAGLFIGTS